MGLRQKLSQYYNEDLRNMCISIIPPNQKVLQIGLRYGEFITALKTSDALGIDEDQKSTDFRFLQSKPEDIELSEKFEYVIFSSLGYSEDIYLAFKNLKKVCNEDTRIIVYYHNYFWEPILKLAGKIGLKEIQPIQNWLSADDIEDFLKAVDIEIIKQGERFLLPVYIPLISTFLNKYVARVPFLRAFALTKYVVARVRPNKTKSVSVSVIIPARDERDNIELAVQRMPKLGKHTEIIFAEGNSKDGTREEIQRVIKKYKRKDIKLLVQSGKGKWNAVSEAFDIAKNDLLIICDADLTTPPEDLTKFYDVYSEGIGEFVNGTRLVYQMEKQAMPFKNLIVNKFFSIVFSWILNQKLTDTLCGTKVISKDNYNRMKEMNIFDPTDKFGDFNLIFGAAKLNLKFIEIPVRYKERGYGETKISSFGSGWTLLKSSIRGMKKVKFV
ncbi:MAG: glycosyltransferase family 2 protein [DPANN group archaeon]|nr:glycosyltransferase family 2 protein [DPANN group archaeon]